MAWSRPGSRRMVAAAVFGLCLRGSRAEGLSELAASALGWTDAGGSVRAPRPSSFFPGGCRCEPLVVLVVLFLCNVHICSSVHMCHASTFLHTFSHSRPHVPFVAWWIVVGGE